MGQEETEIVEDQEETEVVEDQPVLVPEYEPAEDDNETKDTPADEQ